MPQVPIEKASDGLTIKQAAEQLGVHWQTIRNWIASGALPATRFGPSGKIVRIDLADLEKLRHQA